MLIFEGRMYILPLQELAADRREAHRRTLEAMQSGGVMMFFGTGWMTDERKPIGKIKMTNNFGKKCVFLYFSTVVFSWGVAFVVCFLLSIGSMGLAPKKSTIRVGENTPVPWIL